MTNEISRPNSNILSTSNAGWFKQNSNQIWIVAILAIVVAGIVWTINLTQQSQMCSLFEDYQTTESERQHILTALGTTNLDSHRVENGKIIVPTAEKGKFLAAIKSENVLPAIFQSAKDPEPSIFMPKSQQEMLILNRKKQKVQDMILRLPFVSEVWFEMDSAASDSAFGAEQQSAVVMVRLRQQTALGKRQVETIQGIVAGAFAKINAHQVVVTDANVGISYQNLNDSNQSELIEMINWKMNRRQHYLDQLQNLAIEFPGIEIHVEVIQGGVASPIDLEPTEKIANKVPAKFANHENGPANQIRGQLSLNTTGTASIDDPNLFPSSKQSREAIIEQVGYEENIANAVLPSSANRSESDVTETVRVKIRVPQSLVEGYRNRSKNPIASSQRFAELKMQIVERIRKIIPTESLATIMPISITLAMDSPMHSHQSAHRIQDMVGQVWPFIAIAIVGLAGLMWNRNGTSQSSAHVESIRNANTAGKTDEQALQSQLTSLIDDDPIAAAKVIKNWIRNSG